MKTNTYSLWQQCLSLLQDQLSPTDYATWVRPLLPELNHEGDFVLYAANIFVKQKVDEHYLSQITEVIREKSTNKTLKVKVEIGESPEKTYTTEIKHPEKRTATEKKVPPLPPVRSNLNSKYTFDNFVVGKSNQLANAVGQKVAENPGEESTNPLFLYGGTGLGKTHLLHAIGNGILSNNPQARVLYITSNNFIQQMVSAMRDNKIEEFKKFYRSLDALLVDDIQFFAEKEKTQEEFFHIFNNLFERGRQIILISDRYPKEIEKLEERLKSRFGWGLTTAIEPPELETRVAILLKKAEEKNIHLPEEVAFFIGQKLRLNVRELEGALNRVAANAEFMGAPITIDFVQETLKDIIDWGNKFITVENIQKVVAEYYRIKISDLKSKNRSRSIARPRQLAMALSKELTDRSLPEIGKGFGDRDHTTVLHACRTIAKLREEDSNIQEDWSNLIRTLSV